MLFNDKIKIIERSENTFEKGRLIKGKITKISNLSASVQPISGRDLRLFPEGLREEVKYKVYLDPSVKINKNSIIEWDDRQWKIHIDSDWTPAPFLNHNRIFLIRLGDS